MNWCENTSEAKPLTLDYRADKTAGSYNPARPSILLSFIFSSLRLVS